MSSRPSIRPDRCSALRRTTLMALIRGCGNRRVALEELRIAENGVERRAQFVAEADDVAALGLARRFGDFLGLLQLGVGALVRLDFVHQQIGLALRLLLGHAAAFLGEHEQPRRDAGDDDENEETVQSVDARTSADRQCRARSEIDERKHRADHADEQQQTLRDSGRHGCSSSPDDPLAAAPRRTRREAGSRRAPAACSNRGNASPASSTASRSAPE